MHKVLKDYLKLKVSNEVLKEKYYKNYETDDAIHTYLSSECLELFNCKSINKWPLIDKKNILNEIKIAVQINGKTRDIITVKKDLMEKDIDNFILKHSKAKKYIESKKVSKLFLLKIK